MRTQEQEKSRQKVMTIDTYGKFGVGKIKVKVGGRYGLKDIVLAVSSRLDVKTTSKPVWVGCEGTVPGKIYVDQYLVECESGNLEFSLVTMP